MVNNIDFPVSPENQCGRSKGGTQISGFVISRPGGSSMQEMWRALVHRILCERNEVMYLSSAWPRAALCKRWVTSLLPPSSGGVLSVISLLLIIGVKKTRSCFQ